MRFLELERPILAIRVELYVAVFVIIQIEPRAVENVFSVANSLFMDTSSRVKCTARKQKKKPEGKSPVRGNTEARNLPNNQDTRYYSGGGIGILQMCEGLSSPSRPTSISAARPKGSDGATVLSVDQAGSGSWREIKVNN